jgi:hypothetical protein
MTTCFYNPIPTRVWSRVQNPCTFTIEDSDYTTAYIPLTKQTVPQGQANYEMKQFYKGNILQHKANSACLTKSQKYSQLARCAGPNRTKVFATQSEKYTNPNTTGLLRTGFTTYDFPNEIVGSPNNISGPFAYNIPNPNDCSSNSIQVGGTLVCGTYANPCTGEIYITNTSSSTICNPASASDVPGSSILCWNNKLQTWYPRQRYKMNNSTDKWPYNYKWFGSKFDGNLPSYVVESLPPPVLTLNYYIVNKVSAQTFNNDQTNDVQMNNDQTNDEQTKNVFINKDITTNNKDDVIIEKIVYDLVITWKSRHQYRPDSFNIFLNGIFYINIINDDTYTYTIKNVEDPNVYVNITEVIKEFETQQSNPVNFKPIDYEIPVDEHEELLKTIDVKIDNLDIKLDNINANINTKFANLDVSFELCCNTLKSKIDDLNTDINTNINTQFTNLDASLNLYQDELNTNINTQFTNLDASLNLYKDELNTNVNTQITNLDASFNLYQNELNMKIENLNTDINTQITNLDTSFNLYQDNLVTTISSLLDEQLNNIYTSLDMKFEPIDSKLTSLSSSIIELLSTANDILNKVSLLLEKCDSSCCGGCGCGDSHCNCELYDTLFKSDSITRINEYVMSYVSTIYDDTDTSIPIDIYDELNAGLVCLEDLFHCDPSCCFFNVIEIYRNMLKIVKSAFDNKNLAKTTLINSEKWQQDSITLHDPAKLQEFINSLNKSFFLLDLGITSSKATLKPQYKMYHQLYGIPPNLEYDPYLMKEILDTLNLSTC